MQAPVQQEESTEGIMLYIEESLFSCSCIMFALLQTSFSLDYETIEIKYAYNPHAYYLVFFVYKICDKIL